jgi:hypothetical protein
MPDRREFVRQVAVGSGALAASGFCLRAGCSEPMTASALGSSPPGPRHRDPESHAGQGREGCRQVSLGPDAVDTRLLSLMGRGGAGLVALFALAGEPDVSSVAVEGVPASYAKAAHADTCDLPVSSLLPKVGELILRTSWPRWPSTAAVSEPTGCQCAENDRPAGERGAGSRSRGLPVGRRRAGVSSPCCALREGLEFGAAELGFGVLMRGGRAAPVDAGGAG